MIHRFAVFEIDAEARELRQDGRVIEIEDLHFSLLLHLVQNQGRVVTEEELLKTYWTDEDVAVASTLQRAIREVRNVLRHGGAELLIRTYPRLGYRFCPEEAATLPEDEDAPLSPSLEFARNACEDGLWELALDSFAEADLENDLGGADLERWADAALCAARPEEAVPPLERALALWSADDDRLGVARAATLLARIHFEARAYTAAADFQRRARIHLAESGPSRERAFYEWQQSRIALIDGNLEPATRSAERIQAIAEHLKDPELMLIGLLVRGHVLFAAGDMEEGEAAHNDAANGVIDNRIPPLTAGLVLTELVQCARERLDWKRVDRWTREYISWCAESGLQEFTSVCWLHRAALIAFQGELAAAENSLNKLCESLAASARWMEGEAFRVLGDIHFMLGDLDTAEKDFHEARRLGWDPQPGEALLHLLNGDADAALHGLNESLEDSATSNPNRQAHLLAHRVIALLALGEREEARTTLETLRPLLTTSTPTALAAWIHRAIAEFSFSQGDGPGAIGHLERSLALWENVRSPQNAAVIRLCLSQIHAATGAPAKAREELDKAEIVFRNVEAELYLEQARMIRSGLKE